MDAYKPVVGIISTPLDNLLQLSGMYSPPCCTEPRTWNLEGLLAFLLFFGMGASGCALA
jgi:hypothetical protein